MDYDSVWLMATMKVEVKVIQMAKESLMEKSKECLLVQKLQMHHC
jgi:hypothetical protein